MSNFDPIEMLALKLARLNAKTVSFDTGTGGVPALTNSDIAAALGLTPGGVGRDLLEHVLWPDGAKLRRRQLLQALALVQLNEHNRREQDMNRALCKVVIAEPSTKIVATEAYASAHARRWPQWVVNTERVEISEGFEHIRLGVLEELAHPRVCPVCNARDLTDRFGRKKSCERCLDNGCVQYGKTWRAARLGIGRSAFIERWDAPYQWLIDFCRDEMARAEAALIRVLSMRVTTVE